MINIPWPRHIHVIHHIHIQHLLFHRSKPYHIIISIICLSTYTTIIIIQHVSICVIIYITENHSHGITSFITNTIMNHIWHRDLLTSSNNYPKRDSKQITWSKSCNASHFWSYRNQMQDNLWDSYNTYAICNANMSMHSFVILSQVVHLLL